jgi:acetylornithine deacetylase/succinyl-diaminopimelate desuccinylase family protein
MTALSGDLSTAERSVLELIELDEIVELTRSLVVVPGVNPPGEERARAEVLARACSERGLHCELEDVVEDRPNVHARLPGGDQPGLLLLGHSDVVPLGDGWSPGLAPGMVRDGRLFGRGSTDMLGGLAAAVVAMTAIRRSGQHLGGPVELATVIDEEENGLGIRHLLSSARARERWSGCIVAEPTDLQTIIAARGAMYIRIHLQGTAAHSGRPSDGTSAIYGAAEAIAAIERWNAEAADQPHPLSELVGPATWNVGTIAGGSGTSIVPAECELGVDRRLLPDENPEQVLSDLRGRLAELLTPRGMTFDIDSPMDMPGFATPADHPLVRCCDAALGDAGGPGLPLGGWTAACDGGFIARETNTPVVVLGPGSVSTAAHRPDEWVSVADLAIAARTYALIMLRSLEHSSTDLGF